MFVAPFPTGSSAGGSVCLIDSQASKKGRDDSQRLTPAPEVNEIRLTMRWLSDEVVISWPDNMRGFSLQAN
jgi:hypothetical protein